MPDMWLPGAERHPIGNEGAMEGGPSRVIWHATSNASTDDFRAHVNYFTQGGAGSCPHLLWHPYTGEIAQMFPANSRSLSVRNANDGTRTNRTGKYCIQVEVCFTHNLRVPHIKDTPCKNLHKLMDWFADLGIEERWPGGEPTGWSRDTVSVGFWLSNGGHYGHNQVPGNDHVDPGPMPDLFALGGSDPDPEPEPEPDPEPEPAPEGETHTVQDGDHLFGISVQYGVTVGQLRQWNDLPEGEPEAGTVLRLTAPVPPFPEGLRPGASDPSAKGLQRALKAAGYMPDTVELADNYGPQTQAAVGRFHNANPEFASVWNDPAIGPLGWAHLHQEAYGN